MSKEDGVIREPEWNPPPRIYGDEDIVDYFAHMLTYEIVTIVSTERRNFDMPINDGMDDLIRQKDAVGDHLRETNNYFYGSEGPIFIDYKIMRDEALTKIGKGLGIEDTKEASVQGYRALKAKFNPQMSTEEALQIARDFIKDWDW